MTDWHEEFMEKAVSVPLKNGHQDFYTLFFKDPYCSDDAVLVDARVVNEALHQLGAKVSLRWKTIKTTSKTGNPKIRYQIDRGRFQLGQKTGKIRGKANGSVCISPSTKNWWPSCRRKSM